MTLLERDCQFKVKYLRWSCFAVWTKQDWSVSFSTSWAYPTSPLFSSSPWYSSIWVWNLSNLSFLEASIAFKTDDFLSSRISKSFSKCVIASSLARSPLHYYKTSKALPHLLNPNVFSRKSHDSTKRTQILERKRFCLTPCFQDNNLASDMLTKEWSATLRHTL